VIADRSQLTAHSSQDSAQVYRIETIQSDRNMKLALSIFAKDLKSSRKADPFAVVTHVHPEPGKKPTVIGKTETLNDTRDPDWTKLFILENYELGKPMNIVITIHDENSENNLGSAMFEVGAILGANGCILGKELQSGGVIIAHVERCSGSGTLNLKMRGIQFKNTEGGGFFNKSDPFFELQRKRKSVKGGFMWDCVFRSRQVNNNLSPIWSDACVELSTLCDGDLGYKFRIAVLDYDEGSDHDLMGSFEVSVNELLEAVTEGADLSSVENVNTDKAFVVKKGGDEVGKVVIISASTSGIQEETAGEEQKEPEVTIPPENAEEDIEDIGGEDIVIAPDELDPPDFIDYVSGGCQLNVMVAIDFAASNGREEDELLVFQLKYHQSLSYSPTFLVDAFRRPPRRRILAPFPTGRDKE
jgi:hypothetical protein